MSKLGPRRYGDRLLVAGEAENPLRVLHEQVSVERLSSDQLSALEAFAQAMVQKQRRADVMLNFGPTLRALTAGSPITTASCRRRGAWPGGTWKPGAQ